MKRLETAIVTVFGLIFTGLAFAVATETILRKCFSVSLQGVDELGGYCLAIGGALAFFITLNSRAHIRIDILHERLPRSVRIVMNVLSTFALAVTALVMVWMAWIAFSDSVLFNSIAQTPWATPLRYPQALWTGALALFALAALAHLVRAAALLLTRRFDVIDELFSPRGSNEELAEEIADLKTRGPMPAPGLDRTAH